MKVIAHRGACTESLENSWSSFKKAIEIGCERIELDIQATSDGELVVIHDDNLERVTGLNKIVKSLSRQEIEKNIRLSNNEKVPFLDEVMSELSNQIEINIEVKFKDERYLSKLSSILSSHKPSKRVILSSFHKNICEKLSASRQGYDIAFLTDANLALPFVFQFSIKKFMEEKGIQILHPHTRHLSPEIMIAIRKSNWEVYPYVGLKEEERQNELWSYLTTLGVDGLCTNYPRQFKAWLQELDENVSQLNNVSS